MPSDESLPVSLVRRVFPFLAAIGAAAFTYVALQSTWNVAPEMAPHVGTTTETMRLLILVFAPLSPTTLIVLTMPYLGLRVNRDILPV